jgi:hypothetical protein
VTVVLALLVALLLLRRAAKVRAQRRDVASPVRPVGFPGPAFLPAAGGRRDPLTGRPDRGSL